MPSSLAYTRKFIILKKELSTMAGRNPKGHCKLEIKGPRGIVTVNIENAEVDNFYNVVFISKDKSHSVWELGKIFTDDIGRGKGEYTFIQRELEAKNFQADKISGILVMRDGEVLLGGYLDKEDGTIERYIESVPFKPHIQSIVEPATEIEQHIEGLAAEELAEEVMEPEEVQEISIQEEVQEIIKKEEAQEVEIPEEIQEAEIQEVEKPKEIQDVEIQEVEKSEGLQEAEIQEVEKLERVQEVEMQEIEPMEELVNIGSTHESIYNVPAYEQAYEVPIYNPAYDIPATEPIIEKQDVEVAQHELSEDIPLEENIEVKNEDYIQENSDVRFDLEDLDEESMEPDYKTLDYIRKLNQKNQTTNYVLSILRFFPYIDPFKYNLKGYNWWIVELDKENEYRAFLPYFSYIIGGNNKEPYTNTTTTCNQLMSKYGHYLFGLYNEGETVKYFVYGIPGEFTTDEHPYRGANGFNTWYQGLHVEGYWIIYIDPMTGRPVHPVTPMMPTD
ncbi:hypothetical protein [Tissierella carlieri]|uniref:Uncharacterized protein n=1 Tax=Tissierella carlieri TaxID=689904 RepID=A0ABT1SBV0_9FIRM|nr:hypothetical protein [Tissierella carlieri]MCQ4923966.1 hypothetical protein [Tissierella carlieri]